MRGVTRLPFSDAIHGWVAREMHRRGIFRLGRTPFGAFDKRLLLREFGVDIVFDVGANVGGYASELRAFGYTGRIISIEPGSKQFAALAAAANADPLWEVHHAGAGEVDRVETLNVTNDLVSSSFLGMTDRFASASPAVVDGQEHVQMLRLDGFAEDVPADSQVWIKFDVEGYELRAIRGGAKLLATADYVEIELATRRLYEGEPLFFEVAPALYDHGFELAAVASAVTEPSGSTVRFDGLFARPAT